MSKESNEKFADAFADLKKSLAETDGPTVLVDREALECLVQSRQSFEGFESVDNDCLTTLIGCDDIDDLSWGLFQEAEKRQFNLRQLLSLVCAGPILRNDSSRNFVQEFAWQLRDGPELEDGVSVREILDVCWDILSYYCESFIYCTSFVEGILRRNPTLEELQEAKNMIKFQRLVHSEDGESDELDH